MHIKVGVQTGPQISSSRIQAYLLPRPPSCPDQRLRLHRSSQCQSRNLGTPESGSCFAPAGLCPDCPLLAHPHQLGKCSSILEKVTPEAAYLLPQDQPLITHPASQRQPVGEDGLWSREPASWREISSGLEVKRPGFKFITSLMCDLK